MGRSRMIRTMAGLLLLSAALSATSSVVAHGVDHSRDHHDAPPAPSPVPGWSAEHHDDGDHGHPALTQGPRPDAWILFPVYALVEQPFDPDAESPLPRLVHDGPPGHDHGTGPPPSLRAPPLA